MKRSKRSDIESFKVMDIMNEASKLEAQGKSIIHMEVGQPSSGALPSALSKLSDEMTTNKLGYTVALGLNDLRKKISELYKRRYNLYINPERVIVTSGSSAAFVLAFTTFFDAGDSILIGEPGYPSYKNILKALGLAPIIQKTSFDDRYNLTKANIDTSDANGVLVASPANPTGQRLLQSEFEDLIFAAKQKNMTFISDEIYHGLSFNHKDICALEFDDNALVINSFSKYYSMTGWRVGWMIVPESYVRTIERLVQNLYICPSNAGQFLAIQSINHVKYFESHRARYKKNREILLQALPEMGFSQILPPDGAFYLYADIKKFKLSSEEFVQKLLIDTGVAITPGIDFDTARGSDTVRFSFSCSESEAVDAMERLYKWTQYF